MNIIPKSNIEFITDLTPEEIRKKLSENVQPKRGIRLNFNRNSTDKFFEGNVNQEYFSFQKVIYYRNSFLPQLNGKWKKLENETKIKVNLTVPRFTFIFSIFWIGFIGIMFIFSLIGIIQQGTNPIFGIVPLLMLAFGIGLFNYGFNKEKNSSVSELKKILNGK